MPQVHIGTFAFTVETVVLMGRTAHGNLFSRPSAHDRAVAHTVLDRFGIAALADRPYTMISGGERQLVLLARALAQEPQFIVLDEPTASLDFGNQGKVMNEIRALAKSGHGVLFTTHDPNHALRAADRAYLLRDGTAYRRRAGWGGSKPGSAGGALPGVRRAAYGPHQWRSGIPAGLKKSERGEATDARRASRDCCSAVSAAVASARKASKSIASACCCGSAGAGWCATANRQGPATARVSPQ